jgi:hypothetical protein
MSVASFLMRSDTAINTNEERKMIIYCEDERIVKSMLIDCCQQK